MSKDIRMDAFTPNAPTEPNLPPPGQERREVLAARTDALAQAAEEQAAAQERGAIPHDHDALRPERNREIQAAIHGNYLEIGQGHPYLIVKWVNYRNLEGQKIWEAKAQGWKIATVAEFPEAKEMAREDNTIRVGDVLLMCIRMDEHLKLQKRENDKRLRQQFGVEAQIHDLAARNPHAFAGVSTPELGTTGRLSPTAQAALANMDRKNAAVHTAARALGNRMKQGTIPGVPIK